ncbi:MAG: PadR family transcriptional regulator [Oscillospiraceae bacterium]
MSVKHLMLAMFAQRDMYGYELKSMYDNLLVVNDNLNFGQVYSTLARLLRDGLIVQLSESPDEPLADKKIYRITSSGNAELLRWVADVDGWNAYSDNLSYKLAACRLIDRDMLLSSIEAYRIELLQKMGELTKAQQKLSDGQVGASLVIERNIFRLEADINWLAICIDKLSTEDDK